MNQIDVPRVLIPVSTWLATPAVPATVVGVTVPTVKPAAMNAALASASLIPTVRVGTVLDPEANRLKMMVWVRPKASAFGTRVFSTEAPFVVSDRSSTVPTACGESIAVPVCTEYLVAKST